jgi:hypothetical protein
MVLSRPRYTQSNTIGYTWIVRPSLFGCWNYQELSLDLIVWNYQQLSLDLIVWTSKTVAVNDYHHSVLTLEICFAKAAGRVQNQTKKYKSWASLLVVVRQDNRKKLRRNRGCPGQQPCL